MASGGGTVRKLSARAQRQRTLSRAWRRAEYPGDYQVSVLESDSRKSGCCLCLYQLRRSRLSATNSKTIHLYRCGHWAGAWGSVIKKHLAHFLCKALFIGRYRPIPFNAIRNSTLLCKLPEHSAEQEEYAVRHPFASRISRSGMCSLRNRAVLFSFLR